jgi:hypothetical protein
MTLRSEELPPADWPTLAGTELAPVWPLLTPATGRILVVRDGDRLVGCWALLQAAHVEGLWVAPDERRHGRVFRQLLRGMAGWVAEADLPGVLTQALTVDVADFLVRRGARPVPGTTFLWPRAEVNRCLR